MDIEPTDNTRRLRESTLEKSKKTEQQSLPWLPQMVRQTRSNSRIGTDGISEFKTDIKLPSPRLMCPKEDRYKNLLLSSGKRQDVHWLTGFRDFYKANVPMKCQVSSLWHSDGMQIDHIVSFYTLLQKECKKHIVCDTKHHWESYVLKFHDETLELGKIEYDTSPRANSVLRAYHLWDNLQWMCQFHNSSKSGLQDTYGWAEPSLVSECDGICIDPAELIR